MKHIEKTINVDRPVSTVYNQYTQFEDFPKFMEGVEKVEQKDDKHLHWVIDIAGAEREFDAEITEQIPDKRIAWRSTDERTQAGVVTFHRLNENQTRVAVQMSYDTEGFTEKAADVLGVLSKRIEGDLERFKKFIESRGEETGAWRGKIDSPGERRH